MATGVEDPVTTAAHWSRCHVLLGREAGARLAPGLNYEVRYEALVDDPEAECRMLCVFLGLRFDGAMTRFHEGRTRSDPDLSAKCAWLPPRLGLSDWRRQMSREAREAPESGAGDLLDDLGYERAVASARAAALRHSTRIAARFAAALPARDAPLPGGW